MHETNLTLTNHKTHTLWRHAEEIKRRRKLTPQIKRNYEKIKNGKGLTIVCIDDIVAYLKVDRNRQNISKYPIK